MSDTCDQCQINGGNNDCLHPTDTSLQRECQRFICILQHYPDVVVYVGGMFCFWFMYRIVMINLNLRFSNNSGENGHEPIMF